MPSVKHAATFGPADPLPRILQDLACPACGYQDPDLAGHPVTGRTLRVFCDSCGTFVTFSLTDEQAEALQR